MYNKLLYVAQVSMYFSSRIQKYRMWSEKEFTFSKMTAYLLILKILMKIIMWSYKAKYTLKQEKQLCK